MLMNANWGKMSSEHVRRRMKHARVHFRFASQILCFQHALGRHFVHEHPAEARSWSEPCPQHVLKRTGAKLLTVDQCQYGLKCGSSDDEVLPVRTRTAFLTQCQAMGVTLCWRCDCSRRRVPIDGSTMSKEMREYPAGLVKANVDGVKLQLYCDPNGQYYLGKVDLPDKQPAGKQELNNNIKDDTPTRGGERDGQVHCRRMRRRHRDGP